VILREPSPFDDTRAMLREFDPLALATAVAALHVVPGNAGAIWRLEALAGLAIEQSRRPEQQALDSTTLRQMLTEGALASAASIAEDPFEELLTEEITFHGGSYLVGAGTAVDSPYTLRLLLRAFLLRGVLPQKLTGEFRSLVGAALTVSDLALRRAGLDRNVFPEGVPGQLVVPPAKELSHLQQAMAFPAEPLLKMLPDGDIDVFEPLIVHLGSRAVTDADVRDGAMDRWPLLRDDQWLVLARPFSVCTALRHRMVLRAVEEMGAEHATTLFGAEVDEDVSDALQRMALRPQFVRRRDRSCLFTEIHARCDTDKIVAALVLSDDFGGLDERRPYTSFETGPHLSAAHAHLEALAARAANDGDEVLGLIVAQAAGRSVFVGTQHEHALNLTLKGITAADLDVVGFLESGDPLALWKFARAPQVLADTQMTMFSPLDGYGAYRDNERSFAPFRGATAVMVEPALGADHRREARTTRDRHGEPDAAGNVREVERDNPEEGRQGVLYFSAQMLQEGTLSRFVEGAPIGLWVAGPPEDFDLPLDVLDTVAYWLAELRKPIHGLLGSLAQTLECLQFEVTLDDRAFWLGKGPDGQSAGSSGVDIVGPGMVRLRLGSEIKRLVPEPDNGADRLLVGLLVDGIAAVVAEQGVGSTVTEAQRAAVVDAAAPLGIKKHMLAFAADDWPMMEPAGGRARPVQEADLTAARFALGDHLRATFGYRNEQVPHERRNETLRSAVEFLFGNVCRVIDEVSADSLLETLMMANERLIADSERRRAILAAREATYPASAAEMRDEIARANQAAVCCRFLVEYAAAQPSSGTARWSMARYDEALAAASLLLDWGNMSDAVHGELTTMDLLVRDDGQLRLVEYDRYETGRGAYFDVYVKEQRERSRTLFTSEMRPAASEASTLAPLHRVDPYVEAEAGAKLTELGELLVAANLVAREREAQIVALPRAEAVAMLVDLLGWEGESDECAARVSAGIAYLSMGPRVDFLAPPGGKALDTYPWLFARRWSYNRRPFVARHGDADEEILWGRRHVVQAMHVLVGQMTSGRYQALAETSALRRELGRVADEDGAKFEREVAQVVRNTNGRLAVAERVSRLGGDRLQRAPGQPLGDIDVLAGDASTRTLWAVECKDLSGAMTAAEIAREMSAHFRAIGSTSMTKHAERVTWLEARIPAALELLNLADVPDGWSVRGLFVTRRSVHASYIEDVVFPIVPVNELSALLMGGG
jgi:hypothetical protein